MQTVIKDVIDPRRRVGRRSPRLKTGNQTTVCWDEVTKRDIAFWKWLYLGKWPMRVSGRLCHGRRGMSEVTICQWWILSSGHLVCWRGLRYSTRRQTKTRLCELAPRESHGKRSCNLGLTFYLSTRITKSGSLHICTLKKPTSKMSPCRCWIRQLYDEIVWVSVYHEVSN